MTLFLILYAIILVCWSQKGACVKNNVCATYNDYYTINENPNCWYSFDTSANATELIKHYGYPLEIHTVTTEDGYILTVFRIPNSKASVKRGPFLLQPGLFLTASGYLALGKDSLAFVLADAGYDVWIANHRGTEFSEHHVNMTVYDQRYWDYSMDEIGSYDLPAVIQYISEQNKEGHKIAFVGHSLGGAVGLIYGATHPEHAKKHMKVFIMLGQAAIMQHMRSLYRIPAPLLGAALNLINEFDLTRIVSHSVIQKALSKEVCFESPKLMKLCVLILGILAGIPGQLAPHQIPYVFNHFPAGTSIKCVKQLADYTFGPFSKYDYGQRNFQKYGKFSPPIYEVSKINVPVYIMYSVHDWCCGKEDSIVLFSKLSPIGKSYGMREINIPDFNHVDFIFGKDVKSVVYEDILRLLYSIDKKNGM